MSNIAVVVRLIMKVSAVMYMMADAFRYGASKYGDDTWKNLSANEHIEKGLEDISQWRAGNKAHSVLIDACLRFLFAASVAVTNGEMSKSYVAKDETKS
jgi:hypothetical protein